MTLDGDIYNPNGTMSGGESNNRPSALAEYYQFQDREKNMQKAQKKLAEITKRMQDIEREKEKIMNLKNELEIKKITKSNKERGMQESSTSRLSSEIEELEHVIEVTNKEIAEYKKQESGIEKEITTLRRQSIGSPKEVLVKTITKAESDLKKSTDTIKRTQATVNEIEAEIESIIQEIKEITDTVIGITKKIDDGNREIEKLSAENAKLSLDLQEVKLNYENKLHELMRQKEIGTEVQENLERYTKDYDGLKKEQQSIESKRKNLQKECDHNLKILEDLEAKHPYIPHMEKEVENFDKVTACEQLEILQNESDRQSKRVNKKVSSTLDDHQKRYEALTRKREIVLKDKQKLHEMIVDLDQKKQECIEETWRKVDTNLGEIYSMLLPGATSKLESVDDLKGLELRVAFNGDWKDNLGELSGGQRSLLALSFVLALLKYNPAPIYILDEIDAALDMSHTQNIGLMLSTHFALSQFIVVSLKEGMFTNANVLFRTQFIDGKSVIERHALTNNSADEAKKAKRYR